MEKQIIGFNNLSIIKTQNVLNIPSISEKDRRKYEEGFKQNGWYNGDLLVSYSYKKEGTSLKLYCGKSRFFDFLVSQLNNSQVSPIVCVNALIGVDDSFVLIKRELGVSSYPGWWDFPAGLVPFKETLESRLLNRIKTDTGIKEGEISIKGKIPFSLILDKGYFNFFYHVKYLYSKEKLNSFFESCFKGNKPLLLEKSKYKNFLETNNLLYPEILERFI